MSNLPIQCHYDGQIYDVIPTSTRPFSLEKLLSTFQESEKTTYHLQVQARNPVVNNKLEEGLATINLELTFEKAIKPYALVPGGWLPMPFAVPTNFFVDRNVVINLEHIRRGTDCKDKLAIKWWNRLFADKGGATFDPLFYGLEDKKRRAPTFNEFTNNISEGVNELKASFPLCEIIDRDVNKLRFFHNFLLQFEVRVRAESEFLIAASPILFNTTKKGEEEPELKKLIKLAKKHRIEPFSLVFIAAISCLYEDNKGKKFSIGRKLLKPTPVYSAEMAFNALSDIRYIEMTAQAQTMLQSDSVFSLATCDHGLAAFWCALSPIEKSVENSKTCFKFSLHEELTPRLSTVEFEELFGRLHTRF